MSQADESGWPRIADLDEDDARAVLREGDVEVLGRMPWSSNATFLVCLSCGSVEDTDLCANPSQQALTRRHGFRAESHELEIYGTCRNCA